jgi:Protein kinase domain
LLEHNRDPTMSAWEQMKAREEKEKEKERLMEQQQQAEINRLLNRSNSPLSANRALVREAPSDLSGGAKSPMSFRDLALATNEVASSDIKKELARQLEAFEDARRIKQQGTSLFQDGGVVPETTEPQLSGDFDDADDYSDDPFDDNDDDLLYQGENLGGSSGRYRTDFIELGVLGRGGGGEVVRVRNRLDRRIYAIKKIILESEKGKFAQAGAIQNRKLRREVTTISRMTHKNIVRYYQAWVEGGTETISENVERVPSNDLENKTDEEEVVAGDDNDNDNDLCESSSDGGGGMWAKPSLGKFFSDDVDDSDSSESAEESASSEDESDSDTGDFMDIDSKEISKQSNHHSQSTENLLELENEYGFQVRVGVKYFCFTDAALELNMVGSRALCLQDLDFKTVVTQGCHPVALTTRNGQIQYPRTTTGMNLLPSKWEMLHLLRQSYTFR